MVQKKLNKKRLFIFIGIVVVIIVAIIAIISTIKKRNSIEYKLSNIGYSESDIEYIMKLDQPKKDKILGMEYSDKLVPLFKEKHFKYDKLDEYLEYYNTSRNFTISEIVNKINTHRDKDFYDVILDADVSKGELILVNKYYKLSEDYEPSDIIDVPLKFSYSGNKISESIIYSIETLVEIAKTEGYNLVISSGYRTYESQSKVYESVKNSKGEREADDIAARPGHSDYQTGLAFDIEPYGKSYENVTESPEYNWLKDNAYKWGFIQRFPEGTENITGFGFSPWHYRYVGIDAATYIYNNNLTLEEYYGYKF